MLEKIAKYVGIACVVSVVLLAASILVAGAVDRSAGRYAGPFELPTHTVTYLVDNTYGRGGHASITIENGTGGTEQSYEGLPWTKEFTPEHGQFLYVSAQDEDPWGSKGVEVSILVDGKKIRHAASLAQYAIASVSARMP